MRTVDVLILLANIIVGVVALVCGYIALESMDRKTRHLIRVSFYGMCLFGFSMVVIILWGEFELVPINQALLGLCFAIYLIFDRRQHYRLRDPEATIPLGTVAR